MKIHPKYSTAPTDTGPEQLMFICNSVFIFLLSAEEIPRKMQEQLTMDSLNLCLLVSRTIRHSQMNILIHNLRTWQ